MKTQVKPYAEAAREAAITVARLTAAIRLDPEAPLAGFQDPVRALSGVAERLAEVMKLTRRLAAAEANENAHRSGDDDPMLRYAEKDVVAVAEMLSEGHGMLLGDLRKTGGEKESGGRRLRPGTAWSCLDSLISALGSARASDDGTLPSLILAVEHETRLLKALATTCRAVGNAAYDTYATMTGQLGSPYGKAPGRIVQAGVQLDRAARFAGKAHSALDSAGKTGMGAAR